MLKDTYIFNKLNIHKKFLDDKYCLFVTSDASLELDYPLLLEDSKSKLNTNLTTRPSIDSQIRDFNNPDPSLLSPKQEKRPKRLDKNEEKEGVDLKGKLKGRRREKVKRGSDDDFETLRNQGRF